MKEKSKSRKLWEQINENERLKYLELLGFRKGVRRGKTMNVSSGQLFGSLEKQWEDLRNAYLCCEDISVVMRKIADLRNVAGCLFLKIIGEA